MSPSTHSTSGASAASTGSISPRPNAPYSSWICSRLDTWGTLSPRCRLARHAAAGVSRRSGEIRLLLPHECESELRAWEDCRVWSRGDSIASAERAPAWPTGATASGAVLALRGPSCRAPDHVGQRKADDEDALGQRRPRQGNQRS